MRCVPLGRVEAKEVFQGRLTCDRESGEQGATGASGYRGVGSDAMTYEGSGGVCWTASPSDAAYGLYLYFDSGNVFSQNHYARASGFPLRCIQEFAPRGADSCFGQDGDARKYDGRSFGQP